MYHNKISKLNKNKNKKQINVNSNVHRRDLVNLFDEYMQPYTAIILDDDEEPKFKPGFPPKIEVTADKRQGTKYMTHIIGFENYSIDVNDFVSAAKKYFASSTTKGSLHGKKSKMKGGKMKQKVSVQGNKVKELPKFLFDYYGIPDQFINCKTAVTKQPKK
eukprot:63642_1